MIKLLLPLIFISASVNVAFSQQVKISGEVVDNNLNPVAGVNILVKGTAIGKVSDANGRFDFVLPPGRSILLFHFIGFKPLEQEILTAVEFDYSIKAILVTDKYKNRKLKSSSEVVASPITK